MIGYRTVRALAKGGMGRVELVVRQEGEFRRAYARKRLHAALAGDPEARAMFTEEARIAGLLHHPNVVSVIDVGEDEEGPFLVMSYVQGVSISELLRELARREELLSQQVALRIFIEVARGLHAAHELVGHDGERLDIVHRDVSPQNILVGFDGVARLTDFGIAKARVRDGRTSAGVLKGKLGYFAPEQLRFQPVTPRTDLFALGVVLFEALSGRRLYGDASTEEVARRILDEPPPDLYDVRQDLHPALSELLFRLLAKRPEKRPADADEVADALEAILVEVLAEEEPTSVRAYLKHRFAGREEAERTLIEAATTQVGPPSRRRWIVAAVASLALGGAVAGGLAVRAHFAAVDAPARPVAAASPAPTATGPREAAEDARAAEEAPEPIAEPTPPTEEPPPLPPPPRAARGRRSGRARRAAPTPAAAPPTAPAPTTPTRPAPDDELMGWGR